MALNAEEVAKLVAEYGQRVALRGGNVYRAKAYSRAAENLAALTEPLDQVIAEERLREIPGVGDAIADLIVKLHKTGSDPKLDAMRKEIPPGVLEMLSVPGLRYEKVLKLYQELGIASLDALEEAARADRLKNIKGFGPALQAKILQGIEIMRSGRGQRHIHRAAELLDTVAENLKRAQPDVKVTPAGDFRRGCELVHDLALVAELSGTHAPETQTIASGITVYITDNAHLGSSLIYATGSKLHLAQLEDHAKQNGLTLRADGLWKGRKLIAHKSEQDIYAALGLPFIAPELREGLGEIELGKKNKLPTLVEDSDLRGILHSHTERSDGVHTLEEMAEAVRERGYDYFGIADHSKSAHYAGGLSVEEIHEQHREADRLNARYGERFHIFKGIESDILADGSLDYPDEVLARFDFVVASVHSQFRLDRHAQTERIIRAVSNPYTTILGHMTGRQLLRRPGYDVDIDQILAACAEHGVAVEINANPWRLDLDWRWHGRALELGCIMSINPDAHSTDEIDLTHWGVEMARKGGVPKDRVLNCLSLAKFRAHLAARRSAIPKRRKRAISRASAA
jgi:DNA polymerase (family 10)